MPTPRLARHLLAAPALILAVGACAAPSQPGAAGSSPGGPTSSAATTTSDAEASTAATGSTDTDETHPTWAYEGELGPDRWGDAPGAAACRKGREQSPVDLTGATSTDLPDLEVAYRPGRVRVAHLGHTVRVDVATANHIGLGGRRYRLLQLHQHTPAEHTVDGRSAAAEIHLVHRSDDEEYVVLGVRLVEGAPNTAIEAFLDAAPADEGRASAPTTFDPSALLPPDRRLFRYDGSLTTPPCTEGVTWGVFAAPITASAGQLSRLADLSGDSNRPVQPLGRRTLQRDSRAG